MNCIKFYLFFLFTIVISIAIQAQNLKSLDYATIFAKNKVKSRACKEVIYENGKAKDTIPVFTEEFNFLGKISHCTEYFAKGKKMAEFDYYYSSSGQLDSCFVRTVFNGFIPQKFRLEFDANLRLIARSLEEAGPNFWSAEYFTYHNNGVMIKQEKCFGSTTEKTNCKSEQFPNTTKPIENSLSYIHSSKGLPILYRMFDSSGAVFKVLQWTYDYY